MQGTGRAAVNQSHPHGIRRATGVLRVGTGGSACRSPGAQSAPSAVAINTENEYTCDVESYEPSTLGGGVKV